MDNLSNRSERPRKALGKGKWGKKSSFDRRIFPEKENGMSADQRVSCARRISSEAQIKGPTPLQSLSITGSEM